MPADPNRYIFESWTLDAAVSNSKEMDLAETLAMLEFDRLGDRIVAVGDKGKIAVWSVLKDELNWVVPSRIPNASAVALRNSSCNCLVIGTNSGDLFVWYFNLNEPKVLHGASAAVIKELFVSEEQFIFTTDDGRLWLTSARTWDIPVNIGKHQGRITDLVVCPDRALAATAGTDGVRSLWDLKSRLEFKHFYLDLSKVEMLWHSRPTARR